MRFLLILLFIVTLTACDNDREKTLEKRETQGAAKVEEMARLAKGAGDALSEEGSKASEAMASGLTNMALSAKKGVNKAMEYEFSIHSGLTDSGIKGPQAAALDSMGTANSGPSVTAYLIFDEGFKGTIYLKAYDVDTQEIGRSSKVELDMPAEEAKYVTFIFEPQTPISKLSKVELYKTQNQGN